MSWGFAISPVKPLRAGHPFDRLRAGYPLEMGTSRHFAY